MKIENSKLKIVFFGTPEFAIPALNSLVNFGYNIVAVVTQPEKPVGRARVITPSPIKKIALEKNIEVFEPHNLKQDEEFLKKFEHLNPDLCVVVAYGKIIPKKYLNIPKFGFINIHPSLLPKYRGPAPIQTSILNGDQETGVTIMIVDEEIDHGPILAKREFSISKADASPTLLVGVPAGSPTQSRRGLQFPNYKELEKKLAELGAELLIETLPKYINGEIEPKTQNHGQATFTKMFTREDGRINWGDPPEKIYNRIRALNPEPGTWTIWKGRIINIKAASVKTSTSQGKPTLGIEIIQTEGKRETPFREFLNGHPDFDISQLE